MCSSDLEDDISDKPKLREIRANAKQKAIDLKRAAIDQKQSLERFEIESIKAQHELEKSLIQASRPVGPAIMSGSKDCSPLVIEAALAQTVGLSDIEKHYDEKTLDAAHKQFKGRIGVKQILAMAAHANGMPWHAGETVNQGNLRDVLRYATQPIHAASLSTLSLPGVLSNVANKELLQGYMEEDQSWREISRTSNVSDFKTVTSYRLLDNMEYEQLAPDGRIKSGTVGEESYTRQAKT